MHCPEPAKFGMRFHRTLRFIVVKYVPSTGPAGFKQKPLACGMINQPLPKFTVAQDEPWHLKQCKLSAHCVVGQTAGSGLSSRVPENR